MYFDISTIDYEKTYLFKIGGGKMAIRDYWVYQERQNECGQWALYIVKEYDARKPDATTLDFTLYCENIPNATHSTSKVGLKYDRVAGYVDDIVLTIMDYSSVTSQDREQLEREILSILNR